MKRGAIMFSSMGYHTLAISMGLTQAEADMLLNDFKKYRDRTGEIYIEQKKYKIDPMGRHIEIKYLNRHKGIIWRIRFSNKGFITNGKAVSCSIKAVINPKILTGEKVIS